MNKIQLKDGEEIVWEGRPNMNYQKEEFSVWRLIGKLAASIEAIVFNLAALLVIIMFLLGEVSFQTVAVFPGLLFLWYFIFYLYEKYKAIQSSRIAYTLTNKSAYFESWTWPKGYRVNSISMSDVQKVSLESYDFGIGTIYFMGLPNRDFINKDLTTGEVKHHPTFQLVENVSGVFEKVGKVVNGK